MTLSTPPPTGIPAGDRRINGSYGANSAMVGSRLRDVEKPPPYLKNGGRTRHLTEISFTKNASGQPGFRSIKSVEHSKLSVTGGQMSAEKNGVFVPGNDLRAQLEQLRRHSPDVFRRIDLARVESWEWDRTQGDSHRDDFDADAAGGRGSSYVRAQLANVDARAHGIGRLMELMRPTPVKRGAAGRRTIVDLLGGNGLVRQVCARLGIDDVEVVTCDASPHMVETAWAAGIPALLQRAERQLFQSESVEGVLLAYGSHHIPPADRGSVVNDAYRVLRQGGTFLLHDFQTGSPMDTWFTTIVHPYSQTGHEFDHFTGDEIEEYLLKAGFDAYEVIEIDDPYTATAPSPEVAERNLGEYLVNMYGLCKKEAELGVEGASRWAVGEAKRIFHYDDGEPLHSTMEYVDDLGAWELTIPRKALVGVGRKL
ncbi:class I SAM-dependent methyltransferase [Actinoallomurus purpureus]|uniref:class I SAM-dependent methyltransferase n=1 Tax=Actinoallomurus purpureus TaxID=478114 RepID=UPI0020938E3E|nr:class I SAM-dependent methyltransferase [Actinoallomurus purpureus]MCO6005450.1 class I SAM-dependent methyltransferase [Actinoallomurus purpureus]